jgi:hypothetical protein
MQAGSRPFNDRRDAPEVRDLWPRLLFGPVIGAVIPNVSGLIDNSRHSSLSLLASYAWFTVISLVIWEGNRQIYFRLQRREDWLQHPWHRAALLLGAIVLYTVPTAIALMWLWRWLSGDPGTRPYAIPTATLATVAGVVLITHVYETVFLLRDWESDRLRRARTEQARLEAELEALGREVDPHFLFNHLNALVYLIEQRSEAAAPFVVALGDTFRYVLESRGQRLVPLSTELEALKRHETLARLRFGSRVRLSVNVPDEAARRYRLPPVSLGELLQNAIKHNDMACERPLQIDVRIEDGALVVANEIRNGQTGRTGLGSTGVGLANLSQRVRIATGKEVTWGREGSRFVVRLPLL